jgi:Cu2+-exporting ATPase
MNETTHAAEHAERRDATPSPDGGRDKPHAHAGATHGSHAGHADHAKVFRDRFWLTLALAAPVVYFSEMFQTLLGYGAPAFSGSQLIPPLLGTVIFFYGGWPFLQGAVSEARERQPGMMLLIGLAISVAFVASLATELGAFDLDFWWELAALIAIMLLGHWQEMKAVAQASSALEALAELLPDEAERVIGSGTETVSVSRLAEGDVVLVRPGGRVPADGEVIEGDIEVDESMLTGSRARSPDPWATGSSLGRLWPAPPCECESRRSVTIPRSQASGVSSSKRRPQARVLRRWRIAPPRSCSMWRRPQDSLRTSPGS